MTWLSDDLVAAVRREAFLPDTSDQSDADILAFADDALASLIAASIRPGRDGHWLTHADITITPGTTEYEVPRAALGRTVRGVMVVDPSNRTYPLTETDPLTLREHFSGSQTPNQDPWWYAFEGESILLGSTSATAGWTLRVFYLRTPPKLILSTAGAAVESVSSTKLLVVTGTPDPTTFGAGAIIDLVSGIEPYPLIFSDLVVVSSGAGSVEITASTFTVGPPSIPPAAVQNRQPAYVVPSECTVYPPVTRSMWPALVRATAASCLRAVRDPQAAQMQQDALEAKREATMVQLPRDNRRSRSLVGASTLRARTRWGGRGGWTP